jgi:flavin reductase (DIM6/NTAB) family NADH-FMN oxidoreductase RutF
LVNLPLKRSVFDPNIFSEESKMNPISPIDPIPVGKIPSGLFIITAQLEGERQGFLGSFVQQVSFSPLLVMIAAKEGRSVTDLIRKSGRFCLNLVGHQNNGVMKPFWGALKPGEDPFVSLNTDVSESGSLILGDAMAALECQVLSESSPGDHVLFFGEVTATRLMNGEDKPMVHIRKSGDSY